MAAAALAIVRTMGGARGLLIPSNWPGAWYLHAALARLGFDSTLALPVSQIDPSCTAPYWIVALLTIACAMPNTQEFIAHFAPALKPPSPAQGTLRWAPHNRWTLAGGILGALALHHMSHVSEFLYFQF